MKTGTKKITQMSSCDFKPGDMVAHLSDSNLGAGLVVSIDPDVQDVGHGREHLLQILWKCGKIKIQFEHEIIKLKTRHESKI